MPILSDRPSPSQGNGDPGAHDVRDSDPDPLPLWSSWSDVPQHPPPWALRHRWAVEIFAGHAGITSAGRSAGTCWLPPIEFSRLSDFDVADVFDLTVITKLINWILAGTIALAHFGTPCKSFSRARSGHLCLRTRRWLFGVPGLTAAMRQVLLDGNRLADFTAVLAMLIWHHGGQWTIENPASSLIWRLPIFVVLIRECAAIPILLHHCAFGSEHLKPTIFMTTSSTFVDLGCLCPGPPIHPRHTQLRGRIRDPASGKWIWRTSLAARYPSRLCARYALIAARLLGIDLIHPQRCLPPCCTAGTDQFRPAFHLQAADLCSAGHKRKRPLGTPIVRPAGRQRRVGSDAIDAGYQLKRSVAAPLLDVEMDVGATIQAAVHAPHPFFRSPELQPSAMHICNALADDREGLLRRRSDRLHFWTRRSLDLREASIAEIRAVADPHLRNLLFLNIDKPDADREVGEFVHFAFWRELARSARAGDLDYIEQFKRGFDVVGDIARSFVWMAKDADADITVAQLDDMAWDIRRTIDQRVLRRAGGDFAKETMRDSIADVKSGFSIGPFYSHADVSRCVHSDRWIGTERFAIEQKGKLRNIDSATASMINPATALSEHLDIASTDANVAAIRVLYQKLPHDKISGWVLDEKDAYRWIPINPRQRKYAVICAFDPEKKQIAYFVMIGHPFGMRSAVYNYNRRSLLLNTILRNEFEVLSSFYYDDKFGFEPDGTISSAYLSAIMVHTWIGAIFNKKKMKLSDKPIILGILYDLQRQVIAITDDRKASVVQAIAEIFESGRLGPGLAGKLKGRLSFAAMQLWGKIGRAYLRCLSERQYSKSSNDEITPAIGLALREWTRLTMNGTPRPINAVSDQPADIVIFTDGFFPNPMLGESGQARVGGVIFDRSRLKPMVFTLLITSDMMKCWLPRKTQISMIEMFAPVLAMEYLSSATQDKSIIFFVDSESVEGAMVKGYSASADICELVGVFWKMIDKRQIHAYIDRVSTDANIADGPSRDDPRFWKMVDDLGWSVLDTWVPNYLHPDTAFKGLGE